MTSNKTDLLTIPEYYAGKKLFLTGATGFIGKVCIEKLLRCCPDIAGIYCLIRPKKGKDVHERVENLCQDKMFDRLRVSNPNFGEKIHPIHGDVMDDDLGIKPADRQFLQENINIIIHSAATIRFDEPLRLAVLMNIVPVRKMVQLAKGVRDLDVLVHISTAYSNCDREYIEEMLYPSAVEPQKVIDILEWMDDATLNAITHKLVGKKPNTYTFTKQLAETLLVQECGDLNVAIVRPSIVTAAWKEPNPGWVDNINGPSGVYIAAGKGLLRTFKAENTSVADIIPVDFVANLIIGCAWYTTVHKPPRNAQIYQITSGVLNPFTWGEMESFAMSCFKKTPYETAFRRPATQGILRGNHMLHDYWMLVSHLLPAYAADLGFMLMGKKPRMVKIYEKLHKSMAVLEYFTVRTWQWTHNNLDTLRAAMTQSDYKTFYFDVREVDWQTYTEAYVVGTKKYILKEDPDNLEQARAHLKMLRNIRYAFNTFLAVTIWRLFIAKSQIARNCWYFILGLVYRFVQFFRITSTMRS